MEEERRAVDPTRNRLYVANSNSDSISVIDTTKNVVVETVALQPRYDLRPRASRIHPWTDAVDLFRFGRTRRTRALPSRSTRDTAAR